MKAKHIIHRRIVLIVVHFINLVLNGMKTKNCNKKHNNFENIFTSNDYKKHNNFENIFTSNDYSNIPFSKKSINYIISNLIVRRPWNG